MNVSAVELKKELRRLSDKKRAENSARFFKTGKGEYGEGDRFIGVTVPQIRNVCSRFSNISYAEIEKILLSPFHEDRLAGAIILTLKFKSSGVKEKENIFNFYLKNARRLNNWDLVDVSAPSIVGDYLLNGDRKIIYRLAHSSCLWERRIAIVSTMAFIKKGESEDAFRISKILFNDCEDLIHKAIGWMLREVGKRVDEKTLRSFLEENVRQMPRVSLRYAIEHFPDKERKYFLGK